MTLGSKLPTAQFTDGKWYDNAEEEEMDKNIGFLSYKKLFKGKAAIAFYHSLCLMSKHWAHHMPFEMIRIFDIFPLRPGGPSHLHPGEAISAGDVR